MFLETVVFIIVIVLLILVLQLKKDLTRKLDFLYLRIEQLSSQLEKKKTSEDTGTTPETTPTSEAVVTPEPVKVPVPENIQAPEPLPLTVVADSTQQFIPQAVKKHSFSERNPDIEKFIGENLFNKIGIVILVLGIGFFLKYAIDKDWINEIGRISIGFISGGILIALAHRLRKAFTTFSSVLVGGGVAILYFTVTIGFHQYQLFSQPVAFILTILITGFTVALSMNYDRKELALFAILGGFGAPFMISSGAGNYIVLFTYILILNIGMLVLAYYKKWSIIHVVCYLFTIILFGGWLLSEILDNNPKTAPYVGALVFASLFYLVFLVMNIINNIKEKTEFNALEIGILLSNTFLYYTAGILILNHLGDGAYRGLFTALIGLINLAFAYSFYKNEKIDRNLIYLLIGLVLTFISLAAPVQLEGNQITLFWAAESVLLLWLSQKSGIVLIKQSSIVVLVLMAISLTIDWQQVYGNNLYNDNNRLPVIINRGFITGLVVVIALVWYSHLLKSEIKSILFREVKTSRTILALAGLLIGYLFIALELNQQTHTYFPLIRIPVMASYTYLFLSVLLLTLRNAEKDVFKYLVAIITMFSLLCYPLFFNSETIALRNSYLKQTGGSLNHYLFHYLMVALAGYTIYSLYKMVRHLPASANKTTFQWFAAFIILYIASAELDHLLVMSQYTNDRSIATILNQSHQTGFAILWGCFALLCIYIGMKWKSKNIRIISITILAITLLKLFLFDLRGLSEGGKIAAFISLGILLLIISFMYQRLKNLLLSNNKDPHE